MIILTGDAEPFPYPLSSTPYKINPKTGYPYPSDCGKREWGDYYFSEAASKAFQSIYSNVDGLLDEWADFWKKTATYFKSSPSVIGYELINEPFAGDIYRYALYFRQCFHDSIDAALFSCCSSNTVLLSVERK